MNDRDVCYHCGGRVIWDFDFNYEDYYTYAPGEGRHGTRIVHILHCQDCGAEIEYRVHSKEVSGDGQDRDT